MDYLDPNRITHTQFYTTAITILNHEYSLLFQRFNYYLIGTAFLVAAFATTMVGYHNGNSKPELQDLAIILNATGIWLSYLFWYFDLMSTRVYQHLVDYVKQIEHSSYVYETPLLKLEEIRNNYSMDKHASFKIMLNIWILLCQFFRFRNKDKEKMKLAPPNHTWIIPILFMVVWCLIWRFVLPFDFHPCLKNINLSLTIVWVFAWAPVLCQVGVIYYWREF
jgi:hypothetical protein